jgi:3-hydroxybutyryl-CoA dehydratase
MLTAAFFSALLAGELPGPGTIYLAQKLRFTAPVRPGDDVRCEVAVTAWDAARRRATLATRAWVGETLVVDGEATVLVPEAG